MKKISSLLIALGMLSAPVFAQMHSGPHPMPGAESSGASGNSSSGASGSSPMRTEATADLPPPPSPIARLKPVTQDGVTYLCGGVGEEESSYMKQQASGYDLMLTFATRSGAYLADVDVDIRDAGGNTVLQLACDSPILLVDLPQGGSYKVRAEAAGYELNKTVRVAGGRKAQSQRVASSILSWPQQVAEGGGAATSTGGGASGGRAAGSGAR
ncbi:hypothetical protein [Noviherbaspirillum sp. ST9]|uniref:hypothetical protein n=1 Tax=Noviherbaspirillum sp. ST9 TaxID=3401606 RepID=UPI003B58738A